MRASSANSHPPGRANVPPPAPVEEVAENGPRRVIAQIVHVLQGRTLWAIMGLAGLTLGLHHSALTGWWRWDDPDILKYVLEHSPWQYFLVPSAWQEYSTQYVTPWQTLSFDIDLALFGLNPQAFYAHHLIALWVAACLTYLLLRLWADPLWSGLGAGLFLCSAPVVEVAQQLSARHYLEGLVFAVLGLNFFLRPLRRDRPNASWWGGLCYAVAVSAKEVYVPLGVLLPFVPERTLRERWRVAMPFLLLTFA